MNVGYTRCPAALSSSQRHPSNVVLPSPRSLRLCPSLLLFLLPQPRPQSRPHPSPPEVGVDPSRHQLPTSKPWTSGHRSNTEGLVRVRPCSRAVTQEELSNPRGSWEVCPCFSHLTGEEREAQGGEATACWWQSGREARQLHALSMFPHPALQPRTQT